MPTPGRSARAPQTPGCSVLRADTAPAGRKGQEMLSRHSAASYRAGPAAPPGSTMAAAMTCLRGSHLRGHPEPSCRPPPPSHRGRSTRCRPRHRDAQCLSLPPPGHSTPLTPTNCPGSCQLTVGFIETKAKILRLMPAHLSDPLKAQHLWKLGSASRC